MSTYYQELDRPGALDYELYKLPKLGARTFRGPQPHLSSPYLAFVGGAQTFGRFAPEAFPSLLGSRLGVPVLNLGVGGAGPRHFQAPEYLELINGAEAVVIQVLSGRSASNSLFDNRASGGIAGELSADRTPIRSDKFFSQFMQTAAEEDVRAIVAETRADYMAEFAGLLKSINRPKILFWLSTRSPQYDEDYGDLPYGVFRSFPQLVNGAMVEELAAFSDDYVECVSREGLPQTLWESDRAIDGAQLNNGMLENHYYPSPGMHTAAADALEASCRRFVGCYKPPNSPPPLQKFIIVAAERTGTNLLIGLLRDYPDCVIGNELFNPVNIERNVIPWPDLPEPPDPELLDLRQNSPMRFWDALAQRSAEAGSRTVGFKLLYAHGLGQPELLDHLAADKTVMIIHLARRNLLRRLVSERQASATGKWALSGRKPAQKGPGVSIEIDEMLRSFCVTDERRTAFDARFAGHRLLNLLYEDLADRPLKVAARAARFLGLEPPSSPPTIKYTKMGAESLADALVNADQLRARMVRWTAFFDD